MPVACLPDLNPSARPTPGFAYRGAHIEATKGDVSSRGLYWRKTSPGGPYLSRHIRVVSLWLAVGMASGAIGAPLTEVAPLFFSFLVLPSLELRSVLSSPDPVLRDVALACVTGLKIFGFLTTF